MSLNQAFKILAAAIVFLIAACDGPEEREAAFLARGGEFFAAGDYEKARLEFKNARQVNPLGNVALFHLGLIDEIEGRWQNAFESFRLVVEQDPTHIEAHLKLGQLHIMGRDSAEAHRRANLVLAQAPENPDARALRAAAYLREGRLPDAQAEAETALSLDRGNLSAISVLAGAFSRAGRQDAALDLLDRKIVASPESVPLRMLKVALHLERNQLQLAEQDYRALIDLQPENFDHRVNLAKLYAAWGRPADAERTLRKALRLTPDDARPKLALIHFLAEHAGPESAERELRQLIQEYPQLPQLQFALARLQVSQGRRDDAMEVYGRIIADREHTAEAVAARAELAELHLLQGDTETAESLVETVLAEDTGNVDALLLRARILLAKNDPQQAVADLRLAVRRDPFGTDALSLLIETHARIGEIELAAQNLETLAKLDSGNAGAKTKLAQFRALLGQFESAAGYLEEALVEQPDLVDALRLQAEIAIEKKDYDDALAAAQRIQALSSHRALGLYLQGRVYQAMNRHEGAIALFDESLQQDPEATMPLNSAVESFGALGKVAEALEFLTLQERRGADAAYLSHLRGGLHLADGATERAAAAFARAIESNPLWAEPYLALGQLWMSVGQPERAVAVLQQTVGKLPNAPVLAFALAEAYQGAGQSAAAAQLYEEMLQANAASDIAANNLAALIADYFYGDQTKLDRALALAERFQSWSNPYFLDTLGWVHYRKGDYNQALIFLERAVALAPDSPQVLYHLGMACLKLEQSERGRSLLKRALAEDAIYPGIEEARAALKGL